MSGRRGFRRAFTVIEMLVASALLGILLTILTMVFNSTNIAWRTGTTVVANLNQARESVARTRLEADNAYLWNGSAHAIVSIWNHTSGHGAKKVRTRTVDFAGNPVVGTEQIGALQSALSLMNEVTKAGQLSSSFAMPTVGTSAKSGKNYTVNVRSAGPNRNHDDYDDIWSMPDDFDL